MSAAGCVCISWSWLSVDIALWNCGGGLSYHFLGPDYWSWPQALNISRTIANFKSPVSHTSSKLRILDHCVARGLHASGLGSNPPKCIEHAELNRGSGVAIDEFGIQNEVNEGGSDLRVFL
jgi:hypothetical protein